MLRSLNSKKGMLVFPAARFPKANLRQPSVRKPPEHNIPLLLSLVARLIVVLGHERCGAVAAALTSDTAPGHVQSLVRDIQPAVKATKDQEGDPLHLAITENARLMADKI